MIIVPKLKKDASNLLEMLEAQVLRLIEIGAPQELGFDIADYRDQAMSAISSFIWSPKLADVYDLNQCWLMDYRLSDEYLIRAGYVEPFVKLEPCRFDGGDNALLPEGLIVVQGQLGQKYWNVIPRYSLFQKSEFELPGVIKEGLIPVIYWGEELLLEANMAFPGSTDDNGQTPYLEIDSQHDILLGTSSENHLRFNSGSVTVAKPHSTVL